MHLCIPRFTWWEIRRARNGVAVVVIYIHSLDNPSKSQATVTTEDSKTDETYIGLTENTFKSRFANHETSFHNPSKKNEHRAK